MPKTLQISATDARKNLFSLIDLVSREDVQVHITKKGLKESVVLQRNTVTYEPSSKTDIQRVRDTSGILKTSGYIKNETTLAQDQLVKEYLEKNPKGPNA